MKRTVFSIISLALLFWLPQSLLAQSYPKQAINLIIPLAPGDATDVAGRTIGEGLSKLLKVPVVAVNRPGAGGTIGTDKLFSPVKGAQSKVSLCKGRFRGILILLNTTLTRPWPAGAEPTQEKKRLAVLITAQALG